MKKVLPVICSVLILINLICLFLFRQVPAGELWKGYTVLYVSSDANESFVINTLRENGIGDITSASGQYLPYAGSADCVEVRLIQFNEKALKYLNNRSNYFFDKSGEFKLYYVPVSYKAKLQNVAKIFSSEGFEAGVDSSATYPVYLPIFVLACIILLSIFCRNKALYISSALPLFIFVLCFPYPGGAVAAVIFTFVLFAVSNLYGRRGWLSFFKRNIAFLCLLLFGLVSSFASSILSGILCVFTLGAVASIIYIYHLIYELISVRYSFQPVLILPAKAIPVYSKKENLIFPAILGVITLTFVISIFSMDFLSVKTAKITLPSSTTLNKTSDLPTLEDYYKWNYLVSTYPYISLNDSVELGFDAVTFPRYTEKDGVITVHTETLFFDENFRGSVYDKIDSLGFNSLEKLMKSQGEDFQAGYASSGSQRIGVFSIIAMFAEFVLFAVLYAFSVFKTNRRNIKNRRGRR